MFHSCSSVLQNFISSVCSSWLSHGQILGYPTSGIRWATYGRLGRGHDERRVRIQALQNLRWNNAKKLKYRWKSFTMWLYIRISISQASQFFWSCLVGRPYGNRMKIKTNYFNNLFFFVKHAQGIAESSLIGSGRGRAVRLAFTWKLQYRLCCILLR